MPKIINDLKPQILKATREIIAQEGYEAINMRRVAKCTGIAVGTLYNYYKNKDLLLVSVFEESWQRTFEKLDTVLKECDAEMEIECFITTLYDEITKRKGIGRIILSQPEGHAWQAMQTIIKRLDSELVQLFERHHLSSPRRKAMMIVAMMGQIQEKFKDERETNIAFLLSTL